MGAVAIGISKSNLLLAFLESAPYLLKLLLSNLGLLDSLPCSFRAKYKEILEDCCCLTSTQSTQHRADDNDDINLFPLL